jgi:hypothetical protein
MNPEVGGCSWLPEWREVLSVVGLLPAERPEYNSTFVFLRNRT